MRPDRAHGNAHLLHRVALAHGDGAVLQRVAVDGDAPRRPDLVLAPVAPADRGLLVVEGREAELAQLLLERVRLLGHPVLLDQREDPHRDGRDARVQAQHDAGLALDLFLGVGVDQEGQGHAVDAAGGLDHEGRVVLLRVGVEELEAHARGLRVALEVEVGAAGDALELAPAEGVLVLDVAGRDGVVRELVSLVLTDAQLLAPDAEVEVPLEAPLAPVGVPLVVLGRGHEELHLRLLELAHAEHEVAGRDLVAERLADLRDAEGRLQARGLEHVLEVEEDALGRLRAQVGDRGRVLGRAHVRLEHEIEGPRRGQVALVLERRAAGLLGALHLGQLVGPEARLAGLAVHQRVGERRHVSRRLPHPGMHQDARVEALDVVAPVHHGAPPAILDVALQFDA